MENAAMHLSSSPWRNRTRTARMLTFTAVASLLMTGCASEQASTSRQAEGVAAVVGSEQPSASPTAAPTSDEDTNTDSNETTDENSQAEQASPEATPSEIATESIEPTESTEFGQGAEVTVGSGYMDPIAANSWVNIKNRSTWPVTITAYDYSAQSHVQTVVLNPTEELKLWGRGSAVGNDVYTELSWCMDPEQTEGSCPGSTQVRASLGFERSIFYGSRASMTTYFKQPRNLPDNSERVGKSPHISSDTTQTVTLQPTESHVFVPYPDFNDLNSLQFYVSRRQDQLTGIDERKITRFGVIIEDAGSWPAP